MRDVSVSNNRVARATQNTGDLVREIRWRIRVIMLMRWAEKNRQRSLRFQQSRPRQVLTR